VVAWVALVVVMVAALEVEIVVVEETEVVVEAIKVNKVKKPEVMYNLVLDRRNRQGKNGKSNTTITANNNTT
jgi:hypothetical protein